MKTKTVTEHLTRRVLVTVIALGVAGLFCWLLSAAYKSTTKSDGPPAFTALRSDSSQSSLVVLPASRGFTTRLSGPVEGVVDATARAVIAANGAAVRDYGIEPFADTKPNTTFDGRRWS